MTPTAVIRSRPRPRHRRRGTHPLSKPATPARPVHQKITLEAAAPDPAPIEFSALDFDARVMRGLGDRGYIRTTPIQSAALPIARAGHDLIGCAQTGTGKTAAFLLPIIERLLASNGPRTSTSALVLAPTRELAHQIEEDFQGLAYHTGLSAAAVYGGVSPGAQDRALRAPVDVLVATPGRLIDHMGCGACRFDGLQVLVLDEADRMLDMGFWPSVRRIVAALPTDRQTLLFSATMSDDVSRAAAEMMRNPKMIRVGSAGRPANTITHHAQHVPATEKTAWLGKFLRRTPGQVLVFVRTKRNADRLARRLAAAGLPCVALHADRTQRQRTAAVEGFRAGRYTALVATDIAARGLDIDGIEHIVNYEVPDTPDSYVHRVGRAGRAGAPGTALTLIAREETRALEAIERSLNIRLIEPHGREAASAVVIN